MTTDRRSGRHPTGGGRPAVRRLVAALAVTQTVGYGVLYYAFAVLLAPDRRRPAHHAPPRSPARSPPSIVRHRRRRRSRSDGGSTATAAAP